MDEGVGRAWDDAAAGGGVAEMLHSLLAYALGAGIDIRWIVISGDPEFFRITKRIHNRLHDSPGDQGELGAAEHKHYNLITKAAGEALSARVKPGDIVLLHDPQTAGMVQSMAYSLPEPVPRQYPTSSAPPCRMPGSTACSSNATGMTRLVM